MTLKQVVKTYLLAWDFLAAIACAFAVMVFAPLWIKSDFARDIYNIGISVLAIVFSVFFAAMAIIMSASQDEFMKFLQREDLFDTLVTTFKVSLIALFVALMYSLAAFSASGYVLSNNSIHEQSRVYLAIFCFLFLYSLLATLSASLDAIRFSERRHRFLSTTS